MCIRDSLAPVSVPEPEVVQQNSPASLRNSINQSRASGRQSRKTAQHQQSATTPQPTDHSYSEGSTGGIRPGDEEEASAAAGAIPRELAVAVESTNRKRWRGPGPGPDQDAGASDQVSSEGAVPVALIELSSLPPPEKSATTTSKAMNWAPIDPQTL
eukprot:6696241-Prymnesium_polylepis.1